MRGGGIEIFFSGAGLEEAEVDELAAGVVGEGGQLSDQGEGVDEFGGPSGLGFEASHHAEAGGQGGFGLIFQGVEQAEGGSGIA